MMNSFSISLFLSICLFIVHGWLRSYLRALLSMTANSHHVCSVRADDLKIAQSSAKYRLGDRLLILPVTRRSKLFRTRTQSSLNSSVATATDRPTASDRPNEPTSRRDASSVLVRVSRLKRTVYFCSLREICSFCFAHPLSREVTPLTEE